MKRAHIWFLVAVVGIVIAVIALVKFVVIGYYPDEFVPYALLLLAGLGIAFMGDRLYRRAKAQE